jgi:hypothetical protein
VTDKLTCEVCGVEIVRRADGALFHADALPKGAEYHAPTPGDAPEPEPDQAMPAERTAAAMERVAAALEKIVAHLYRA